MLYLLYGENLKPLDSFIENLLLKHRQLKKIPLDNFKNPKETYETLLKGDTLFGEKNLFILKNFPKDKYRILDDILNQKEDLDIILYYWGENLSLKRSAAWVEGRGGLVKGFTTHRSRAVFQLLDSVSGQNLKLAVASLRGMKKEGENLFLGLTFLFTRIEKIILAKYQTNPRLAGRQARLTKQAASFKLEKLLMLQKGLLELENKLKSTSCDPWQETESWLVENLI